MTRPVLRLVGRAVVSLNPGESRTVDVPIPGDRFAVVGTDLRQSVEPGAFTLLVGASSADLRLRAVVEVRAP